MTPAFSPNALVRLCLCCLLISGCSVGTDSSDVFGGPFAPDPTVSIDPTPGDEPGDDVPEGFVAVVVESPELNSETGGFIGSDLETVSAEFALVQVNAAGDTISPTFAFPQPTVTAQSDGSFLLDTNSDVPFGRIDLLLQATLSNGVELRAPFISSDNLIIVSPLSEFAVQKFLQAVTDNPDVTLEGLASDIIDSQLLEYSALGASVVDFEPDSSLFSGSLAAIINNLDDDVIISTFVESAVDSIFVERGDITDLEDIAESGGSPVSEFNSVLFTLGVNSGDIGSGDPSTIISTSASTIVDGADASEEDDDSTPQFTLTNVPLLFTDPLLFLSEDLPTNRTVQDFQITTAPEIRFTEGGPVNSLFTVGLIPAFLNADGFVNFARVATQTIVDDPGDNPGFNVGTTTFPFFSELYSSSNLNSLFSVFLNTATAEELIATSPDTLGTVQTLEEQTNFGFVVHHAASNQGTTGTPFDSDLINNDYGGVVFTQTLANDGGFELQASIQSWSASPLNPALGTGVITAEAQTASSSDVFETFTLERASGSTPGVLSTSQTSSEGSITFEPQGTIGFVNFTTTSSFLPEGIGAAAAPAPSPPPDDGDPTPPPQSPIFSIGINGPSGAFTERGIAHGLAIGGSAVPDFAGSTYRLFGNGIEVDGSENRYFNLFDSSLVVDATGNASLTFKQRVQRADTDQVFPFELVDLTPDDASGNPAVDPIALAAAVNNAVQFSFEVTDNPDALGTDTLSFQGIVSNDGELMVLVVTSADRQLLGLVYGYLVGGTAIGAAGS